jgi:hypothetical protein
MPTFKPKANKKIKISKKTMTTLDGKHKEYMNEFKNDEYNNIPKLKKELKELNEKLINSCNISIELIMDIKDRILEIELNIKQLKEKKNDYFLDNSKYIFEYFENKKNISNIESKPIYSKCKLIDNFFKIKNAA